MFHVISVFLMSKDSVGLFIYDYAAVQRLHDRPRGRRNTFPSLPPIPSTTSYHTAPCLQQFEQECLRLKGCETLEFRAALALGSVCEHLRVLHLLSWTQVGAALLPGPPLKHTGFILFSLTNGITPCYQQGLGFFFSLLVTRWQ